MVLLAFVLTRIKWLQKTGFTKKLVVSFFVAKCLAGFAYNFIALHYIPNRGDIWPFFDDGLYLYHSFLQSPSAFFDTWSKGFHYNDLNALNTDSGLIRSAFEVIKTFHFLLDFLSFGSLPGNTVIFNFLASLCFFYCWKFFKEQFASHGIVAGLIFFLLPSMFFYSAGILKEGFVISLLCLLVPLTHQLVTRNFSVKIILGWVLALASLCILKFFVAGIWLFCTVVWCALAVFSIKQWLVVLGAVALACACFFYSVRLFPAIDLPGYLVQRQAEFLSLPAASAVPVAVLTPDPQGFLKALPMALNNVLFKPLPGEGGKLMYLLFSAEMILYWFGLAWLFIRRKKADSILPQQRSLATVLLLFAMLNLLVIGLIVPNIGALLRYRSIFFPFLAFFATITTGWEPSGANWYRRLSKWVAA
ncbi:MAG: hypothetical protein ABIN95_02740 [Mucilaginibacter sp.]